MKKLKCIICFSLLLTILFQLTGLEYVLAAPNPVQPAPEKLRIEAPDDAPDEPPIGYNEFYDHYADFKSDPQKPPVNPPAAASVYLNYYLQEVNKPYKPAKPTVLKEGNVPARMVGGTEDNSLRMTNLTSGTIYYAYSKAFYTYTLDNTTYTSPESPASNTVKFLTDISISAMSFGPNQIKIEWDDVWNSGRRIDYKLYVSENKTFANTPPIYIGQEQMGQNGPVTVNQSTGKLEYIHTVRDPGRVYYIKIVPDVNEPGLKRSAESPTVAVSSYILAKTTRMSTTDFGTVWKLEWSPVVTGLGDSTIKVSYQIYKGTSDTGSLEQYVATVDDTVFFFTLPPDEKSSYYIIKAVVTRNGEDVYPGIRIQSEKIYVKESEVPANPATPEIVDEFKNAGITVISYVYELKPNSATILWRAPKKGTGAVDTDVVYDIWLISDPNSLDDPPAGMKIASDLRMTESNYVMSGTTLLGYKYVVNNLTPNSTYYFKIVAKKTFLEFEDNVLVNKVYTSLPALKIIITPADGPIDQPVAPGRPPVAIKKVNGKDAITGTTATIQLKNKWYEYFEENTGGRGRWVYKTRVQLEEISPGIVAKIESGSLSQKESLQFRKVVYDNGITFDVGCVEYTPDFDYDDIDGLPTNKIIGFPSTPNDPNETINNSSDPHAIMDGQRHNVDITVSDLDPNATYVIWVRAVRRSQDLLSGPSDALIITTVPEIEQPLEKPTVPVFNFFEPGDNYVDLGWNIVPGYKYYLKYATKDDISTANESIEILPEELENVSFYRVLELDPGTIYYFWIQAEASNSSGETIRSEWSDSLIVKTLPQIAPSTPKGFGVKGTEDAITKNSITYEWIAEDGMEYILEIASDINYGDAKEYTTDKSEYKVEGLRSNFRYYARLYAYDPEKELRSLPTQSIIVRTKSSSDEFDSDQDAEDVISGDFIVKEPYALDHIWKIRITGVNADRFIEHIRSDNILDYNIDLSKPPEGTQRISLVISARVFAALTNLKENLIVTTERLQIIIRPGVFPDTTVDIVLSKPVDYVYEIGIVLNSTSSGTNTTNLTFKTPVTGLEISRIDSGISIPYEKMVRPLKLVYQYSSSDWYKEGTTAGYVLSGNSSGWQKNNSTAVYNADSRTGRLSFESVNTGRLAVAEAGKDLYDDISTHWARNAIANVASAHKLKFVSGRKFEPEKYITNADAARFMLDMLDYSYGGDYMSIAVKSGLITSADSTQPEAQSTRENIIAMAIRLYELKASEKAVSTRNDTGVFKDIGQVSASLLPKIKFAAENGIIISRFNDTLGPKDPVTRAETAALLEKLLRYTGEL